jgi:hypothetical protein
MHSQHQFQWYPKHLYLEEIDMLNATKKHLKPLESIFFYLPCPQKVEYQLTMLAALQSCCTVICRAQPFNQLQVLRPTTTVMPFTHIRKQSIW